MNLGFGELLVILTIAFVVVGPKDLPKIARALARVVRQLKGVYAEVKGSLDLEEELSQVKQVVKEQAPVQSSELTDIRAEIARLGQDRVS